MSTLAERLRRLLPAAWLGLLLTVGALVAPTSFALLARADAGRLNGRLFERETWVSLALALLLWFLERARARRAAAQGQGSVLNTEMVLLLAVLLVTLMAGFGLQPMMEAARGGAATPLGFGAMHALSVGLYALKLLLVAVLAWRAASGPGPSSSTAGSAGRA